LCRQKRRLETKRARLGILEAVEEVGLETFLSDRESTPGSLPSLEGYNVAADRGRSKTASTTVRQVREESTGAGWLSDFDARYLGALDDFDELEDIEPGFLTTTGTSKGLVALSHLFLDLFFLFFSHLCTHFFNTFVYLIGEIDPRLGTSSLSAQ
jgi:hypothetical protein